MLRSKSEIYQDTVKLAQELFRSGGIKASPDYLIDQIFKKLKEINEKEEEYKEYENV